VQLIKAGTLVELVLTAALVILVWVFISWAKRGKRFYIRKLPAIDAIEDAVGRCAEMGRPVHFCTGQRNYISSVEAPQTVAALACLGHTAKSCAKHDVPLMVVVSKAESLPLHIAMLREIYETQGKPFDIGMIHYFSEYYKSFLMNYIGDVKKFKPGAVMLIGPTVFEYAMIPDVARSVDAMSIGGSSLGDYYVYSPMYDHALVAEELFAASAYLTREPVQIASIQAEDVYKVLAMGIAVVGTLLLIAGINIVPMLGM